MSEGVELRCKIDRAFGISRDEGLLWMNSARHGDLGTIKRLLKSRSRDESWRLLHYDGQGTSYGFVGSTALHWAAANDDAPLANLLIEAGISINCQNNGGSTALHSAVMNGRQRLVDLLLSHGAHPFVSDCCGDTPVDLLEKLQARGVSDDTFRGIQASLEMQSVVCSLPDDEAAWEGAALKRLGKITGCVASGEVVERHELLDRVRPLVAAFRKRLTICQDNDAVATTFLDEVRVRRAHEQKNALTSTNADEEHADLLVLKEKADIEKTKGNEKFEAGNFTEAVKCYTTAIAMVAGDAVYYSNRAACYLAMSRFADALKDASMAISLRPEWPKPYLRAGTAYMRLGRFEDAAAVLEAGAQRSSNDPTFLQLLQEANEKRAMTSETKPLKRPWFDCELCDNKTRDRVDTPCCQRPLCGTCWRRRLNARCPYCGSV